MEKHLKEGLQKPKKSELLVDANNFKKLDVIAMVRGIGRKATDEELIEYLSTGNEAEPIDIEIAFSKYAGNKR